jgi:hypothetical protein
MIGKFEVKVEKLYLERITMKDLRKRIKWIPDSTEILIACKIVDHDDKHELSSDTPLAWKPRLEKPKAAATPDAKT